MIILLSIPLSCSVKLPGGMTLSPHVHIHDVMDCSIDNIDSVTESILSMTVVRYLTTVHNIMSM